MPASHLPESVRAGESAPETSQWEEKATARASGGSDQRSESTEKPQGRRGRWPDWKAYAGPVGGEQVWGAAPPWRVGPRTARPLSHRLRVEPAARRGGASGLWAGRGGARAGPAPDAPQGRGSRSGEGLRPRWRPRGRGSASARRQLGCRWPGGSRGGGGGGGESPWLGAAPAAGGGERGPSLPAPASRGRAARSSQWGGGREERRGEEGGAGAALPGRTRGLLLCRAARCGPRRCFPSRGTWVGQSPGRPWDIVPWLPRSQALACAFLLGIPASPPQAARPNTSRPPH